MVKQQSQKQLQEYFGQGTLLVSQDVVRRDMLRVQRYDGNLSHDLLCEITKYGKGKCELVILEGILNSRRYGDMLKELIHFLKETRIHITLIYR